MRIVHYVAAAALAPFVYADGLQSGVYATLAAVVFFPALALTGLLLWQGRTRAEKQRDAIRT